MTDILDSLRVAGLVTVLVAIFLSGASVPATAASGVAVQTTPLLPLVDVVFLATTSAGLDRTLFVSTAGDCSSALTPICTLGRSQSGLNYNDTTCIFNITGASLSVDATTAASAIPPLYWCSSAAGSASFASLQMHKVAATPSYAYLNQQNTLTLNAATPVGTTVGLYTTTACTSLLTGTTTTTVQDERTLSVNVGNRGISYLCATIPTVMGGSSVLVARTIIYGTNSYDIYTTTGIRHRSVTISADATFLYLSLSTDPQCMTLAQDYQQTTSGTAVLTVNVPKGSYYFCAVMTAGVNSIGVFVPALSTFEVTEYGVQPQTMYANRATTMSFAMDAVAVQSTLQAALFTTSACSTASGSQLTAWGTSMTWTISTAGTYYACVRTGTSTTELGYVNQVVVSAIPSVVLSRNPGIMGLGEVATVTRSTADTVDPALLTVGISASASCGTLIESGDTTTTGSTASFYVPENSPSTVFLCVSNRLTTDQSNGQSSEATTAVFYSLGSLTLSTYSLSYPALRTRTTLAIQLDSSVAFSGKTYMYLTPALTSGETSDSALASGSSSDHANDATCDAAIAASADTMSFSLSSSGLTLSPVTFPSAGSWLLCVKEVDVLNNAAVRLRTLTVYGDATVTPSGVLPGIPARLSVSSIPPSTTVSLTTSTSCSASMTVVATTTSSLTGTATLSVTASGTGTLLLCVGYRGEANSQDTAAVLMLAGTIPSTTVRVVPAVAVAGTATTLTFSAPGAPTLQGLSAVLVPTGTGTTTCPTGAVPSSMTQLAITATASASSATATATFTPDTSMVGTSYLVCAGTTGAYLSAGTIHVLAAPTLTTVPTPVAHGLPTTVKLPPTYMAALAADIFVLTTAGASCTQDLSSATRYATGAIDAATATTATFLAPSVSSGETSVRLCVAKGSQLVSSTLGYADAGTIALTQFTTASQFAQRDRTNALVGTPTLGSGALFLVACAGTTCAAGNADAACGDASATRYTTSSTVTLTAPVGTYLLCQSVASPAAVVGSSSTLRVIDPYVMTTTADTTALRAYVPFAVTMSGGPAETSGTYTVVVQPASVDCSTTTTTSQSFLISGGSGTITITDIAPRMNVQFCVRPATSTGFQVMTAFLIQYMTPAAVISGRATTVTSASTASGLLAKLSSTSDCSGVVATGTERALVNGAAAFTVDGCDSTTSSLATVYYCEKSSSSATWDSRGPMGLLRASNCSGGEAASIGMVYAAPGTALTSYGIGPSAYLTAPRLSATAACTSLVDAGVGTVGYAPAMDESAVFYVCAQVVGDATLMFTTTVPTLTVRNWAVLPRAALSRYNATMGTQPSPSLSLNYAAPSANTFLSTAQDCGASLAAASGLAATGGVVVYRTVGVSGLVYVCTTNPLTSQTVAVATFLSVTPPSVTQAAPAIVRGGTYTATLVVLGPSPLYSMQPGADSKYTYHSYYTFVDRSVYLSVDGCGSELAGTTKTTADSNGRVSFVTSSIALGVSSVTLCTGTAAGVAETLSVSVAPGVVYPTQYVTGVWNAPTYMPTYPSTAFQLSRSNGDCSARAGMPTFTTDSQGYGTVSLVTPQSNVALAVGTYTLCTSGTAASVRAAAALADGDVTAVDTIEVIEAAFFSLRGTTFVVGVPGTMELLQDLRSSYLYTGFSESRGCESMTTAYGSWSAVSDTTLSVAATAAYSAGLYLCAQSQQNSSVIALPASAASTSSVVFAASSIALPPGGWDACSRYTLDRCVAPGSGTASSSSSDVLAMVHGDCCSSTRGVVGESDMSGATCRLSLDYAAVASYGSGATFNLCVLRRDDASVCTTVASGVSVSTACTPASSKGRLSGGAIAGIVVGCVVGGLLLIALVVLLLWCCCCRQRGAEDIKTRDLIAFQEFAEDDQHMVGYMIGGRNPLLYYPSGKTLRRSISPSPPYPSTGSSGYSVVEEMEEGERDQIALQEARARYNLRLYWAEAMQEIEVEAKNAAVDAGLDTTWASGDSYLRGVAQPVRRCVESIITEDGEAEEGGVHRGPPPAAVASAAPAPPPPRRASTECEARAFAEVPEERAVNLTADGNTSVEGVDAVAGRRRKVRSRSIESAPRPPLTPSESFITNDDFEEREEEEEEGDRDDESGTDIDVAYNGSVTPDRTQNSGGRRDAALEEDGVPRRRIVVRHITNPSSVRSRSRRSGRQGSSVSPVRSRSSQRREDSRRGQPHIDPTMLGSDALQSTVVEMEEPRTPAQATESVFAAQQRVLEETPDRHVATATLMNDTTANDSAVLSRSPIASPDPHDMSEGAITVGLMEGVRSAATGAEASPAHTESAQEAAEEDEDDDLLSFTITQRFHDEKRFLLEQEDGRRQRLWNWEDEERAQLAQEELNAYMALPPPDAAAPEGLAFAATTSEEQTSGFDVSHDAVNYVAVSADEEEEEVYHAPSVPAMLPTLPPAPRPQTLLNEHYHVVAAEPQ